MCHFKNSFSRSTFDYTEQEESAVRDFLDCFTIMDTDKAIAVQCLNPHSLLTSLNYKR